MKRSFLMAQLVLALAITVVAQTAGPTPTTATGTIMGQSTGAFFALSVADVNALSRWYQEKLGFRVLSQGEAPNKIAKFAILEGDGTIIELIQHRDAKPLSAISAETKSAFQVHGIFKVGMVVKNLDDLYREVKKRGVPIAYDLMPAKDIPLRSFSIRDGEGNLIQFFGN